MKESPEDLLNTWELLMKESPEDQLNIWELLMKESPEGLLNIWELLMKKRHEEESPEDYKDTFDGLKRKLNKLEPLVEVSPDGITISAMRVNYSRENLEKVLDFINDITEGEAKL